MLQALGFGTLQCDCCLYTAHKHMHTIVCLCIFAAFGEDSVEYCRFAYNGIWCGGDVSHAAARKSRADKLSKKFSSFQ